MPTDVRWSAGTDAGEHQQLGRADRSGTDDHLAVGPQDFRLRSGLCNDLDADRPALLDHDARDHDAGADRQILAVADRLQIGDRGRRPSGVSLRQLIVADAFLAGAVEIGIEGYPHLLAGAEIGLADRQWRDRVRHAERSLIAVEIVGVALVVLGTLEVGQHVAIAPAGKALLLLPGVVVARVAARVDLGIDRRSAADHLGLRVAEDAVLHVLLRHGRPAPGRDALGHLGEARRHMDQRMPVAAAGFEKQHGNCRVFAQPVGEHAACGTSANDDVVGHGNARSRKCSAICLLA